MPNFLLRACCAWVLMLNAGLAAAAGVEAAACTDTPLSQVLAPARSTNATAEAVWMDRSRLRWPGGSAGRRYRLVSADAGELELAVGAVVGRARGSLALEVAPSPAPAVLADRFRWFGEGLELAVPADGQPLLREMLRGQVVLVEEGADGRVLRFTGVQHAALLDDLYAAAESARGLGVTIGPDSTRFRLWAPTARNVSLCVYRGANGGLESVQRMSRDAATGIWSLTERKDLSGRYYTYLVDVFVPGQGLVRNRVTDPYSVSLNADSQRSLVADLDAPALKPRGWDAAPRPPRLASPTDLMIYELHVRDFSAADASVPEAHRGKYMAFTHRRSNGMRHLQALARAGMTDVHLLPAFDFATVPDTGCVTPQVSGAPDGEEQQATATAAAAGDCYNWGYDPWHFNAPEGSYATDASDGAKRVLEFRRMVQALNALGLRVGMDVVYNHMSASGQDPRSVLDRIVPGYYHRLDRRGAVTNSTCCANTATEHRMMARLMIDSAVLWVRHYRIDSFRFDLMGHQPREAMERLQAAVDRAAGRRVHLIGEGWNFGEVADGARFVQASQLSLPGSGIGTFSDRARDAIRGGGHGDEGVTQIERQGFVNGLFHDPNAEAQGKASADDLMRHADLVRAGLAGSLRDYVTTDRHGQRVPLSKIPYAGTQPAGYVAQPGEVVNYVENHDNQTLFDANVFKLPLGTSREDRARVQHLASALNAFSQGIAYFHAGQEILRSKSMDRNSYDSGDWFNRIDWTLEDNGFGSGLPPARDNRSSWPWMKPRLADAGIKPGAEQIRWTRDAFLDLLRIRAGTTLLRLRTADDVKQRLRFHNVGPAQVPELIVGHLDGRGYRGAAFADLVYLVNVGTAARTLAVEELRGRPLALHPVLASPAAADRRALEAGFDPSTGRFTVPARTAVVFVGGTVGSN